MAKSMFSLTDDFPPVSREQWREVVDRDLNGAPFERKLVTHTYEGIDIQPLYGAEDWPSAGDPSGFSGVMPHTRGATPLGNAYCGWDIRQERTEPDLDALNVAILEDLERGVTSVQLRIDRVARRGFDGDDPEMGLIAGADGAPIYRVDDLDRAFQGVHLEMVGIGLEAGSAFHGAASLLVALWDRREVPRAKAWGNFNADPLAVLARSGRLRMSLDDALGQMTSLAKLADAELPRVRAVRVGTAPYHHAGATAAQDIAYSMATAVEYLRALEASGLPLERAARQLLFNYAIGTNQFLASAKLRAARRLWTRVLEVAGVAPAHRGMMMHVKTSKRVLTHRDPWVNMLRATVTTFAAAAAGAQIVTVAPFDSALGRPGKLGRRIARNTQVILQEESHLHRVNDPGGGSWYLEKLTDDLAAEAWKVFQAIEAQGGMRHALAGGVVAEQIDSAFKPRLKNLSTRRDAITGVSEFPNLGEEPVAPAEFDLDQLRQEVVDRLRRHRQGPAADLALDALSSSSDATAYVAQASLGATIGQLSAAVRKGSTAVSTRGPLHPHPYAQPFEELRDAADRYLAECGTRPRVFLANMGPIAHHTGRAGYSKNFFEAGGFEVLGNDGFDDAVKAAEAFQESGAHIAVICSSDKLYESLVPTVAPALRSAGARHVILAGNPGSQEETYRNAGVDRFIFIRCNVLTTLRELLVDEGVLQDAATQA